MKKRIFALFLTMALVLTSADIPIAAAEGTGTSETASPDAGTSQDPDNSPEPKASTNPVSDYIQVSSGEELIKILENPKYNDADILLVSDISLNGTEIKPSLSFSGTFDGGGHTLSSFALKTDAGNIGLFAELSGTVRDLTIQDASVSEKNISYSNQNVSLGILAGVIDGATFDNCEVSGTIDLNGTNYYKVGGFAGQGSGTILNSGSRVDISYEGSSSQVNAGGFVGGAFSGGTMDASAFEGTIRLKQTNYYSSNLGYYFATGLAADLTESANSNSNITNCEANGAISITAQYAKGWAYGIDNAKNSTNYMNISIECKSGTIQIAGVNGGSTCSNNGALTGKFTGELGGTMYIWGTLDCTKARNYGEIQADNISSATYTHGVANSTDGINYGDITAGSVSGSVEIYGVSGAKGACLNYGALTAETKGSITIIGILGTENKASGCFNYGDILGKSTGTNGTVSLWGLFTCDSSENDATVTGTSGYKSHVSGLGKCNNSINTGVITSTSTAADISDDNKTPALVYGSENGTCNLNKGDVYAYGVSSLARGVLGANSKNTAKVYSHSEGGKDPESTDYSAVAKGAEYTYTTYYSTGNIFNSGDVYADSENGAAHAIGSTTESTSSGKVTATAHYINQTATTLAVKTAHASGSTSTQATIANSYTAIASIGDSSTVYSVISRSDCTKGHNGIFFVTDPEVKDSCMASCAVASSCFKATDTSDASALDIEEPNPEDGQTHIVKAKLYSNPLKYVPTLYYAAGNFSYDKDDISLDDPDTTNYDAVYLKLFLISDKILSNAKVTITLPDGLSFSNNSVLQEKTIGLGKVSYSCNKYLEDCPVYLLYSPNYYNKTSMSIKCSLQLPNNETHESTNQIARIGKYTADYGSGAEDSHFVSVPNEEDPSKIDVEMLKDPSTPVKDITQVEDDQKIKMTFDPEAFIKDANSYNQDVAIFTSYMSELIEGTKKDNLRQRISYILPRFGFSKIMYSGKISKVSGIAGQEEEYICATKTIVTKEEKVKTIVLYAVQGSDDLLTAGGNRLQDWIGNGFYWGPEPIHQNFLDCGKNNYKSFTNYADKMQINLQNRNNRIVVTGHSRGAAISNWVAKFVKDNAGDNTPYCYTYAAPSIIDFSKIQALGSESQKREYLEANFDYIYNVVNYGDLVPFVPGAMSKFGHILVFNQNVTSSEKAIASLRNLSLLGLTRGNYIKALSFLAGLTQVFTKNVLDHHNMPHYINAVKNMSYSQFGSFEDAVAKIKKTKTYEETLRKNWFTCLIPLASSLVTTSYIFSCPVDVDVLDENGTVVCRIENDDITFCDVDDLYVLVYEDKKQIIAPKDKYTFDVKGYDDGKMNYSMITGDENGEETAAYLYRDIPVSKGKSILIGNPDDSAGTDTNYRITGTDQNSISPDEILEGNDLGTCNVELSTDNDDAFLFGSGQYTKGDFITLAAITGDEEQDALFSGWYTEDGEKVSDYDLYSFTIDKDVKLIAKYDKGPAEDENVVLNDPSDVVYQKNEDGTYYVQSVGSLNGITKFVFPDELVNSETKISLAPGLFKENADLKEIVLPKQVAEIPDNLCFETTSLAKMNLEDCNLSGLGKSALARTSLESVTLPEGCVDIGNWSLLGCSQLKEVNIPSTVTRIGNSAFYEDAALEKVTFAKNSALTTMEPFAFYGCTSLEEIVLPEKLTSINSGVFQGCTNLKKITIPKSVTSINNYAFDSYENITFYVTKGSYAETFAKNNNIAYEYPPAATQTPVVTQTPKATATTEVTIPTATLSTEITENPPVTTTVPSSAATVKPPVTTTVPSSATTVKPPVTTTVPSSAATVKPPVTTTVPSSVTTDMPPMTTVPSTATTGTPPETTVAPLPSWFPTTMPITTTVPSWMPEMPTIIPPSPAETPAIMDNDTIWAEQGVHAYLHYQTSAWDCRNEFGETVDVEPLEPYGCRSLIVGGEDISKKASVKDVLIRQDGTYTVSISGIDLSGAEYFHQLGISTDMLIPENERILAADAETDIDRSVSVSDVTVKIDGNPVEKLEHVTLPVPSSGHSYYCFAAANNWYENEKIPYNKNTDPLALLPTKSIEITFTIKGIGGGTSATEIPTKTTAPVPAGSSSPAKTNAPAPVKSSSPAKTNAPVPVKSSSPAKTNAPAPVKSSSPAKTNAPAPVKSNSPAKTNAPAPVKSNSPVLTIQPVSPTDKPGIVSTVPPVTNGTSQTTNNTVTASQAPSARTAVANHCKKVTAAKKTVTVKRGKSKTITFKLTNANKKKTTTDTIKVKSSYKKVTAVVKKKTAAKVSVKVSVGKKAKKKKKAKITLTVGKKSAKTTVKVK